MCHGPQTCLKPPQKSGHKYPIFLSLSPLLFPVQLDAVFVWMFITLSNCVSHWIFATGIVKNNSLASKANKIQKSAQNVVIRLLLGQPPFSPDISQLLSQDLSVSLALWLFMYLMFPGEKIALAIMTLVINMKEEVPFTLQLWAGLKSLKEDSTQSISG